MANRTLRYICIFAILSFPNLIVAAPGVIAGEIALVEDNLPRMIHIPSGKFEMGTNDIDRNKPWRKYCTPARSVTLTGFDVGETLVTYALYKDFLTDSNYKPGKIEHPEDGPIENNIKGADSPMIYVNWYEAILFCNWLSLKKNLSPAYVITGKIERKRKLSATVSWVRNANGYRLLTQAEMEYLLRDGGASEAKLNAQYMWKKFGLVARGEKVGSVWSGSRNSFKVVFLPGMQEWTWSYVGLYSGKPLVDPEGPDAKISLNARVMPGFVYHDYFYAGSGLMDGFGDYIAIRVARNAP